MNLTTIIDDCLARLAAGETVADCLARYAEAAEQLAPILSAAEQLHAFSHARLTEAQRLRAKVALREELAAQRARSGRARDLPRLAGWARLRVAPLAVLVAVVLFGSLAFTAVAASQPGDFVYPVRVAAERVPALVQPNASRRVAAELAAADRRLSDLERDAARHSVAVEALLRSDQAAIERTPMLSEAERMAVTTRVAAHAEALRQLAERDLNPETATRLQSAAATALAMSGRFKPAVSAPDPTATVKKPASQPRRPTANTPVRAAVTVKASVVPSVTPELQTYTPAATFASPGRKRPAEPTETDEVKRQPEKTPRVQPSKDEKPSARATLTKTPPASRADHPPAQVPQRVRPTSTPRPEPQHPEKPPTPDTSKRNKP